MKFITVSTLRSDATKVVAEIEKTKEDVVVTKNGKPVILMQYITEDVFSIKAKEASHGKRNL
ncbi:MAG: type II toxin-antitoxin system Phd/YefM family antitoxin [Nitrospirae bacterium]|nr:type II toxin-antitoxin system Phd/YefM family antitoxin [Nitrospirota bacterium]